MRGRAWGMALALFAGAAAPAAAQGGGIYGDVSGDGKVMAADALAILAHTVGRALPAGYTIDPNGDVNADGKIMASDALIVLSFTVGRDVSLFRVGKPVGSGAAPSITAISPATLTPGGTFTISGSGFGASAAANAVTIDGVAANVTQASASSLTVTVPARSAFRCEPTRSVTVSVSVSGVAAKKDHPLSVAVQRALGVGQSVAILDPAELRCNELAVTAGRYMVSVFNTSTVLGALSAFQLRGAAATQATTPSRPSGSAQRVQPVGLPDAARTVRRTETPSAHLDILEANRRLVRQLGPPPRASTGGAMASQLATAPAAVGDVLTLRIPDWSSTNLCTNYRAEIQARVVYSGPRAVVVEDRAAPLAGTMDNLFRQIGMEFESTMYPILEQNFGNPLAADPQMGSSGRTVMLFSKVVNDFKDVAGFVAAGDFYPRSTCAASNHAHIFYAKVPTDPAMGTASGTREAWMWSMRSTIIHEVKHITSFSESFARTGGRRWEESWLEEATARIAEEIWARAVFGYSQHGNVSYRQSLYCEWWSFADRGCAGKPAVMLSHFEGLAKYLETPETLTPLGRTGSDDWSFYGSGWSLLRWAIDHSSRSEAAFLRAVVQEPAATGIANLQLRAGKSFPEMLADWSLALAVDDYPGFSPARAQLRFPSWNTRDIYQGLSRDGYAVSAAPLTPRAVPFGAFSIDVPALRAGTSAIFELSGAPAGKQLLELRGVGGVDPAATLRMAVVRVQ